MRNLSEDRAEFADAPKGQNWVARERRKYGIKPNEPTTWFADLESERIDGSEFDHSTKFIGRSPLDVLSDAKAYADSLYARNRVGIGRWIMETFEDGENAPTILRVYPMLDWDAP